MRLFGKLLAPWRSYGQTVFRGDWAYRLEGLFESGIDFSGKRILDAGCNVGIVAYEVAKQGPASIHGIDYFPEFIETAKHVFHGYRSLPHRFDVLDLTKQRQVERTLATDYDIVIFMAVWQHIYERHGAGVAERVAVDLARRCAATFIARTVPLALADAFSDIMRREGFELARKWRGTPAKTGERVLTIYSRVRSPLSNDAARTARTPVQP
ncbi:MAG: class I SAM-dependent methyltransferase [Mesorhizobium sp.]